MSEQPELYSANQQDTARTTKRFVVMGGMVYYASGGFKDYLNSFDTKEEAETFMREWLKTNNEYSWVHIGDLVTGEYWEQGHACNPMGGLF